MQTRLAFNSGEVDEEVSLRFDVEAISRAAICLENWEVSLLGSIKRRRGMKTFAKLTGDNSRLMPYIYSYSAAGERFLVEAQERKINIYSIEGELIESFTSLSGGGELMLDPDGMRWKQVNALLIMTGLTFPPTVLKYDKNAWTLERFEWSTPPWREEGVRDSEVVLSGLGSNKIGVEFESDEKEKTCADGDLLRVSFWLEQQETRATRSSILSGVNRVVAVPLNASRGVKYAIHTEDVISYWVCKDDWDADQYVTGLDAPGSYPSNFEKAENLSSFTGLTAHTSIKDAATADAITVTDANGKTSTKRGIAKNTKIAMQAGYWEYFTCVKNFVKGSSAGSSFADFPEHFVRGVEVGDALTCGGAWSFLCSGLWFGSYEVRRNYDTADSASLNWEPRGISFSRVSEATNTEVTGNETEECYLRLYLTRSKYMGDSSLQAGFPPDSCDNKLVVEGYKHHEILKASVSTSGAITWENVTKLPYKAAATVRSNLWSWTAFSERYGYPLLCEVYNQRMVFASTVAQPQTIWLSRVDDLNNFLTGTSEDAAMALTINTTSQNPICWMTSQNHRILLGTSEAEWVLTGGGMYQGISNENAQIEDHSHVGSDGVTAICSNDKALYVERGGGRVYEYGYSMESDAYLSKDLTVFAPHIGAKHGGITSRCTYIRKPQGVAAFVLGDGQLALCTYNRMQEVHAWHRWTTDGNIKDVCALPNGNKSDLIFLIVERDGADYIEAISEENDYEDAGGRDYASVMLTNALINPIEARLEQASEPGTVNVRLGEDYELASGKLEVSIDGERWARVDRREASLRRGWHNFVAPSRLQIEPKFGMRVTGNTGFVLNAIQA